MNIICFQRKQIAFTTWTNVGARRGSKWDGIPFIVVVRHIQLFFVIEYIFVIDLEHVSLSSRCKFTCRRRAVGILWIAYACRSSRTYWYSIKIEFFFSQYIVATLYCNKLKWNCSWPSLLEFLLDRLWSLYYSSNVGTEYLNKWFRCVVVCHIKLFFL